MGGWSVKLIRIWLTALFFSALTINGASAAITHGNLHAHGQAFSPPPPGQTLTVHTTENQIINTAMATAVTSAGCTNSELISVALSGTVPVTAASLGQRLSVDSQQWRKVQLTGGAYVVAQPVGATPGSGVGTLTVECNAGTSSIAFNVASGPVVDWNYGTGNLTNANVRQGGYPVYNLAYSVTPDEWQVDSTQNCLNSGGGSVACNTLWEVYGEHLVAACTGSGTTAGGACPAQGLVGSGANKYHGSTWGVASVPTSGNVDVPLVNPTTSATAVIHLHMTAHQFDVAPPPTFFSSATNGYPDGQQLCPMLNAPNKVAGDVVMAETPMAAAVYSGGISPIAFDYGKVNINKIALTCTLVDAGTPTGSLPTATGGQYQPGFVNVTMREPWRGGASGLVVSTSSLTNTNHQAYLRFSGWDFYTAESAIILANTRVAQPNAFGFEITGAPGTGFFQFDNNKGAVLFFLPNFNSNTLGDGLYNTWILDNDIHLTIGDGYNAGQNTVYAWDTDVSRNFIHDGAGDFVDIAVADSDINTPLSHWDYNFYTNVYDGCNHTDFYQAFYASLGGPRFMGLALGNYHGPTTIGNVWTAGAPRVLTQILHASFTGTIAYDTTTAGTATFNGTNQVVISGSSGSPWQFANVFSGTQLIGATGTPILIGYSGATPGGDGTYTMSATVASASGVAITGKFSKLHRQRRQRDCYRGRQYQRRFGVATNSLVRGRQHRNPGHRWFHREATGPTPSTADRAATIPATSGVGPVAMTTQLRGELLTTNTLPLYACVNYTTANVGQTVLAGQGMQTPDFRSPNRVVHRHGQCQRRDAVHRQCDGDQLPQRAAN